jgi:hypothetical protein
MPARVEDGPLLAESAAKLMRLLVDGHVHVHPCYDEKRFLEYAYANLGAHGPGLPTLLLTEVSGISVFAKWRQGHSPWEVTKTEETASLILGGKLLVIAGRQIVTKERIEVLGLICEHPVPDQHSLEDTIQEVTERGGIAVLPWGVGKWFGTRGKLVARASRKLQFLGDNAGRPFGWRAPHLFRDHVVLPGTDPLGLPGQQNMVGTYGFILEGFFDLQRPAEGLREALLNLKQSPSTFGGRVGPMAFVRQQIGLRLIK